MYNNFNYDVIKSIIDVNNQIDDELEKNEIDKQKLSKLYQKQLLNGLMINCKIINRNKLY